jgi:hypothetical protein
MNGPSSRFITEGFDCFVTSTPAPIAAGWSDSCRAIRTKLHLLLHLGYFGARQRLFRFELPAVRPDVDYLRRR